MRSYRYHRWQRRPETVSSPESALPFCGFCPQALLLWCGLGEQSLGYPKVRGQGSAHPVPSQVWKYRGSELTLFLTLSKLPSGSKVRFSPPGHNEYKQDWFVHSVCVKQPWSDRKWVWGQEVAYFLRQKGAIEKNLRLHSMFLKLWGSISPPVLLAALTLGFTNGLFHSLT